MLKKDVQKEAKTFFTTVSFPLQKKEKNRARILRRSEWWKRILNENNCYYCGKHFPPKEMTMDHKVPIARGGKSTKGNVVPSCKACNTKKKCKTSAEWFSPSALHDL